MQIGDFERTIEIVPLDLPDDQPFNDEQPSEPLTTEVPDEEPVHVDVRYDR